MILRNCANQPPEKCHADPAHLHADGEGQDIECRDVRNAHHLEKLGRSFALGTASTGTPHLPGCLTHYRTSRTPQPHCITSAQPLPPPPQFSLVCKIWSSSCPVSPKREAEIPSLHLFFCTKRASSWKPDPLRRIIEVPKSLPTPARSLAVGGHRLGVLGPAAAQQEGLDGGPTRHGLVGASPLLNDNNRPGWGSLSIVKKK